MSASSPAAWRGTLAGLIAFHIFIIIASNYLVQLPITLFGWHTTWGAFSFPFIFLATDLTVRLLGKGPARLVIARVMIPALIASYVVSVLFQEAAFRGFSALLEFNTFVARISWQASSPMCSDRSSISRYSTASVVPGTGGPRQSPRPSSATCWTPSPFSSWRSGAATIRSWRSTGWKSPRWTTE